MIEIIFSVPTHQRHFVFLSQALLYGYNMTSTETPLIPIFCMGHEDLPETAIAACSWNEEKGPQIAYNEDYPWNLIEGSK